jgi:hypothetical protein
MLSTMGGIVKQTHLMHVVHMGGLSWARKIIRIRTKPKTQQGKQITRNVSISLIQDYKHKGARQEHNIC